MRSTKPDDQFFYESVGDGTVISAIYPSELQAAALLLKILQSIIRVQ